MKSKILITGGSSGLGRHFKENSRHDIINISRGESCKSVIMNNGPFNGFVHYAGIAYIEPVIQFTEKKFNELMWVNVGMALEIIKYVTKKQYRGNDLSIVLMGSVAATRGASCVSQYAASKGAIVSMTKSLAIELAPKGIRVNCISPGQVKDTRMTDVNKNKIGLDAFEAIENKHLLGFGYKHDVSNLVEYLLSDKAKWITGQNFIIDGGYTA